MISSLSSMFSQSSVTNTRSPQNKRLTIADFAEKRDSVSISDEARRQFESMKAAHATFGGRPLPSDWVASDVVWADPATTPPTLVSRASALVYSPEWLNELNPLDEQYNKSYDFYDAVAHAEKTLNKEDPWHQTTEGKLWGRLTDHWNAIIDETGISRNISEFSDHLNDPDYNAKLQSMMYDRLRNDPDSLDMMTELGMDDALRQLS